MEVNGDNVGPSLPSNYVTIHDLKQRWLQQQNQKPKLNENDAASKTSNDVVSRSRNELKSPPTPEVEGKVLDDSKTLIRVSTYRKINGHINHPNEERQTSINNNNQSRNKNSSRAPRNPRIITNQNPTGETAQPEPVEEMKKTRKKKKKKQNRNRNPNEIEELNDEMVPIVEDENVDEEIKKQQTVREAEHRNRNRNRKEVRESKHKTAPVVVDQNVVEEIKQQEQVHVGERRNRIWNQKEVRESKEKMTPIVVDQNVVDEAVVAAASATVKEINVINVSEVNNSNRRGGLSSGSGNGRFQGSKYGQRKPPYYENTKGKMSQMWVKKGESVPNSCI